MNIPRPTYHAGAIEQSLLLAFQLEQLEAVRMVDKDKPEPDKQDEGPRKPQPEIIPPKENGDKPDVGPEIPTLPKTPETERPNMPEIGPKQGPDVVEVPKMPSTPETGVPERELPGGILH
jgi:hypothetical protein